MTTTIFLFIKIFVYGFFWACHRQTGSLEFLESHNARQQGSVAVLPYSWGANTGWPIISHAMGR